MRLTRLLFPFSVCLAVVFGTDAAAQARLECVSPAEPGCRLKIPPGSSVQRIVIHVRGGKAIATGANIDKVRFILTGKGENRLLGDVEVGTDSLVQLSWSTAASDTGKVIKAELTRLSLAREIPVGLDQAVLPGRVLGLPEGQQVPHWYEKRQLRDSIRVLIGNSGETCASNVVVFRPINNLGSASPDSVRAATQGINCVASTWWRLGEGVGRQHLRAFLADEPSKTLNLIAVARALPRIGAGVVATKDHRDYHTLESETKTIQVTKRIPRPDGGDSIIVVDSTAQTRSVVKAKSDWLTTPTANVDFPVIARARWLRASLAVSLENPDRDWYIGASALQTALGVTHENLGVDVHVMMHIGRRRVVVDASCDDDLILDDCKTKDKLFFPMGFGFMAFVDGSSFIGTLGSIFK